MNYNPLSGHDSTFSFNENSGEIQQVSVPLNDSVPDSQATATHAESLPSSLARRYGKRMLTGDPLFEGYVPHPKLHGLVVDFLRDNYEARPKDFILALPHLVETLPISDRFDVPRDSKADEIVWYCKEYSKIKRNERSKRARGIAVSKSVREGGDGEIVQRSKRKRGNPKYQEVAP